METRAHYILVGVFTIVMSVALFLFALWAARAQFNEIYSMYDIVFQGPVRGLAKGGEVRFNGIKVGEIIALQLDEKNAQQVLARVRVDGKTPVRTSTEAGLEAIGLTGVNLIQLTAGDPKDPLLVWRDGFPPPRIKAKPAALDDLVAAGQDLAQRGNKALAALQTVLTEENIKHISHTLANLDAASTALAKQDGALERVSVAAKSVTQLADATRTKVERLDHTIDDIDRAAREVGDAAAGAKHFVSTAQDAADVAAYQALPDISSAARDLRRLSLSLQQLTGDVESGSVGLVPGAARKPTIKVDQ
jgi:phospholipid/cholesterol/gamma-HCH transport system substrate-binding protein